MTSPSTGYGQRAGGCASGWLIVPPAPLSYDVAWAWQKALVDARAGGVAPDALLLVEHPPVYTLGRSANENHLLLDEVERRRRGIEVRWVERGGDVTYHGPGQLVGYPIVDVRPRGRDVHRYLRDLEEVLIRALADFGVQAFRVPRYTGVWVGGEKIAAIGVAFRRWVSYHGFALNVAPDLSFFDGIVPCGIADRGVTSLRRLLGVAPAMEEVVAAVRRHFEAVFGVVLQPVTEDELLRRGLHWSQASLAGDGGSGSRDGAISDARAGAFAGLQAGRSPIAATTSASMSRHTSST